MEEEERQGVQTWKARRLAETVKLLRSGGTQFKYRPRHRLITGVISAFPQSLHAIQVSYVSVYIFFPNSLFTNHPTIRHYIPLSY